MIGGFEEPTEGRILLGDERRRRPAALQARRQHRLPELRALPAYERSPTTSRSGSSDGGSPKGEIQGPGRGRSSSSSGSAQYGKPEAAAALRRPAAARRARAGAREPSARPAARRAARRARPQAPQADAARAEANSERDRHHVRSRHARPGGGDDDGGHDRGHEPRPDRAARPTAGALRAAGDGLRRRLPRSLEPPARHGGGLGRGPAGRRHVRPRGRGRPLRCGVAPACGRRRSRSAPGEGRTSSRGRCPRPRTSASPREVVVETPLGDVHVFAQNIDSGRDVPAPRTQVTLTWRPDSTFVVDRDDTAESKEGCMNPRMTRNQLSGAAPPD